MITRKAGPALAAGCTDGAQAGDRRRRSRRWRWPSWPSAPACRRACSTSSPARADGDRRRADLEPDRAQADLHRLDRGRQAADAAVRRARSRRSRWSSAATRRSSCSTTPISTRRSRARSPPSTATPARPASAPTASWCRTASTTPSPSKLAERGRQAEGRQRPRARAPCSGPLIDMKAVEKVEEHIADAVEQGRQGRRRRQAPRARRHASSSRPS